MCLHCPFESFGAPKEMIYPHLLQGSRSQISLVWKSISVAVQQITPKLEIPGANFTVLDPCLSSVVWGLLWGHAQAGVWWQGYSENHQLHATSGHQISPRTHGNWTGKLTHNLSSAGPVCHPVGRTFVYWSVVSREERKECLLSSFGGLPAAF